MNVLRMRDEGFRKEYGILCHRFLPSEKFSGPPFGATWCEVEPGGSTAPHDHFEGETFFILEGSGSLEIDSERETLGAGDLVYIPPFSRHVLHNASVTRKLVFLSCWWEPQPSLHESLPRRVLITSAPPTPNGDLHVGHLSGPYVAADVLRRYLQLRGVEVSYLSGSDDHQSYVAAKASALALTPEATIDRFAASILGTLEKAGAKPDHFLRPSLTPDYRPFVQNFFQKLVDNGAIVPRKAESLRCDACEIYLYEVHVSGLCPHCAAPTNGNGCEKCGHVNDCANLKDPVCNHCRKPATRTELTRFYFPLEPFREKLEAYYREAAMSPRVELMVRQALTRGLPEISATHAADWGIPCPVAGYDGQVIYEWIEMAAGYLFSSEKISGAASRFWKAGDAEVVPCFGFDNSFFYAAIIPALLLAYDPEIRLPRALVSNEFYHLDGQKFSTSRNHAVWGDELLDLVPSDVARLFLAYDRPETRETNFTRRALRDFVRDELRGQWEPWLASFDERLAMESAGRSPEFRPRALTPRQQAFLDRLSRLALDVTEAYGARSFSLNTVARALSRLVQEARSFAEAHAPLAAAAALREERSNALALELAAVRLLCQLSAPLMPHFSKRLQRALGVESLQWETGAHLLPSGIPVGRLASPELSASLDKLDAFAERP